MEIFGYAGAGFPDVADLTQSQARRVAGRGGHGTLFSATAQSCADRKLDARRAALDRKRRAEGYRDPRVPRCRAYSPTTAGGVIAASWAQTQAFPVYEQLLAGSRYFDLRAGGDGYIWHGPIRMAKTSDVLKTWPASSTHRAGKNWSS